MFRRSIHGFFGLFLLPNKVFFSSQLFFLKLFALFDDNIYLLYRNTTVLVTQGIVHLRLLIIWGPHRSTLLLPSPRLFSFACLQERQLVLPRRELYRSSELFTVSPQFSLPQTFLSSVCDDIIYLLYQNTTVWVTQGIVHLRSYRRYKYFPCITHVLEPLLSRRSFVEEAASVQRVFIE